MKKLFTLIAATVVALSANAQNSITFEDGLKESYSDGDFVLTRTDEAAKHAVDENTAYFGTADEYHKQTMRFKTGGKSSSKSLITLTIPADGVLEIDARTGSNSATDRNIVVTQNGDELFNKIMLEADAVKVMIEEVEKNVYPVNCIEVKAGTVEITYPTNSINFYGFRFYEGKTPVAAVKADKKADKTAKFVKDGKVIIVTENGSVDAAGAQQ